MKVTISTVMAQCALTVSSVFMDSALNLKFESTDDSQNAYRMLIASGFKCYHVGKNAPHGPYVAIYEKENRELSIMSK